MTDQTASSLPASRNRVESEYRVYYTIIFVLALPFVSVAYVRDVVLGRRIYKGILGRARDEAATITPLIFSA